MAHGWEEQGDGLVLTALGFVHREGKSGFRSRELGWMENSQVWKQNAGFIVLVHDDPDVSIGQALVWSVVAIEHRSATRPMLHGSCGPLAKQGSIQSLDPPGALPHWAEGDPGLQCFQ